MALSSSYWEEVALQRAWRPGAQKTPIPGTQPGRLQKPKARQPASQLPLCTVPASSPPPKPPPSHDPLGMQLQRESRYTCCSGQTPSTLRNQDCRRKPERMCAGAAGGKAICRPAPGMRVQQAKQQRAIWEESGQRGGKTMESCPGIRSWQHSQDVPRTPKGPPDTPLPFHRCVITRIP